MKKEDRAGGRVFLYQKLVEWLTPALGLTHVLCMLSTTEAFPRSSRSWTASTESFEGAEGGWRFVVCFGPLWYRRGALARYLRRRSPIIDVSTMDCIKIRI
ncbi:hypothetical protein FPV67DRAFT_1504141 [Lyophyllum atratum]|nr:hypothetical protein FPV67DRAFT_1504141 [Lyophyllum atratum]